MSLAPGIRIGPYEIVSMIGAGGMGEVYRARDTSLKRDVALKTLPASFASDSERLARFRREAEILASLNHPNIAQIHGLEESGGVRALVMELVEGDDLSQRMARRALPLDEALPIAKQIAEAFEAAHELGIIHRDLKPANVKVRADGTVKVLDFGLAKAIEPAVGSSPSLSMSPTITTPAHLRQGYGAQATEVGMILGTASYMSPEQARGRPVDKRSDIWAFGVMLYEMLTGTRLYAGDSVPETLGLIFSREPELATLPAATPPRVRTLIARCLVKDPHDRLRDIGEARVVLGDAPDIADTFRPIRTPVVWRWVPWLVTAVLVAVAAWALWRRPSPQTTAPLVTRLDIGYPHDVESFYSRMAISPDGRTVSMVGTRNGLRHVYVRSLDRSAATELPDTGGANAAVFSPDGGSVAVLSSSGLITRIALADQQRTVVTSGADNALAITWSEAGIIYSRGQALWIVSPEGGAPRPLTTLEPARREVAHSNAVVLPGGHFVLFASQTQEAGDQRIESVAIDGGPRSVVVERAGSPVWSPTGHLLFARDGAVLAVALDPTTGKPRGTATPIMPAGEVEPWNS